MESSAKKGRAKSCTACRQVKLRCDVREKHPNPCSRCDTRKQECRMDSNFKRVNTRSKRTFNLAHGVFDNAASQSGSISSTTPDPQPVFQSPFLSHNQQLTLPTHIFNHNKSSTSEEKWLDLEPLSLDPDSWSLGSVVVEQAVILDLFKQFEEFYYVHLPVLEPVRSLHKLCTDSPALFWTVVFTAARFHPKHFHFYTPLYEPFRLLISNLLSGSAQNLKDLQALLIICEWPLEVGTHSDDPSLMHSGFLLNAALHMGLDKYKDEVLFGHRRVRQSLALYEPKYCWRTWLKIFQISTKLSTWHGLRPPVSTATFIQNIAGFYDEDVLDDMIITTEIQRQVTRMTATLDDLPVVGSQTSFLHIFAKKMQSIRQKYTKRWNNAAEIEFQGSMILVYAHFLLLAELREPGMRNDLETETYVAEVFQLGHGCALAMMKVIKEIGLATGFDPYCAQLENGGSPLLAHPKQHFRLAFFACVFLFKYLDTNANASVTDQDAARNAVSVIYRVFNQFSSQKEVLQAARRLEVLGRSVVPGQRRIQTIIKTRMGASLNYNAIWTVAKLRGRELGPEFDPSASATVEPAALPSEIITNPDSQSADSNITPAYDTVFPWGVWDDATYDQLGYGFNEQSFSPNFLGIMGDF